MDPTIQLGIGSALGFGGLGLYLWNKYRTNKKLESARRSMAIYNGRVRNAGLSVTDPKLVNMLKKEIGTKVPVSIITDKYKQDQLGIGDNAFFAHPSSAKYLQEVIQDPNIDPKDVDKYGMVIMSDKFGSLPILGHELGHAKDYEEGNMSNPWVTLGGSVLGLAGAIAANHGIREWIHGTDFGKNLSKHYRMAPAVIGIAGGLSIAALTNWWVNRRRLGDESRATEKAKAAILRVAEKVGKEKELNSTDKMLDKAYSTYEAVSDYDVTQPAAFGLMGSGISTVIDAVQQL